MRAKSRLILFPVEGGDVYVEDEPDDADEVYFGLLIVTPRTIDIHKKLLAAVAPIHTELGTARLSAPTGMLELFAKLPAALEPYRDEEYPVLIPHSAEMEHFAASLWELAQEDKVQTLATECIRTEVEGGEGETKITFYQKHSEVRLQSGHLGAIFRELSGLPEQALTQLLWDAPDVPEGWSKTEGPVREYFDQLIEWNVTVNNHIPELDRFQEKITLTTDGTPTSAD